MLHPSRPQALQIPCHHHHLPLATHQAMAAASTLATCKSTTATPSWHTRPTSMLCHHGMQDPPQHQHTTMLHQHGTQDLPQCQLTMCKPHHNAIPAQHARPTMMPTQHSMQDPAAMPSQHTGPCHHPTMPTQHRDPTTTPSSTQYARPGLRQMTTMTVMGMVVVGDSVTARHPYFSDCTYFIYAINRLFFV